MKILQTLLAASSIALLSGCLTTKPMTLAERLDYQAQKKKPVLLTQPQHQFFIDLGNNINSEFKQTVRSNGSSTLNRMAAGSNMSLKGILAANLVAWAFSDRQLAYFVHPRSASLKNVNLTMNESIDLAENTLKKAMSSASAYNCKLQGLSGNDYRFAKVGRKLNEYYHSAYYCSSNTADQLSYALFLTVTPSSDSGFDILVQQINHTRSKSITDLPLKNIKSLLSYGSSNPFLSNLPSDWVNMTSGYTQLSPEGLKMKISLNGQSTFIDIPDDPNFDELEDAKYFLDKVLN